MLHWKYLSTSAVVIINLFQSQLGLLLITYFTAFSRGVFYQNPQEKQKGSRSKRDQEGKLFYHHTDEAEKKEFLIIIYYSLLPLHVEWYVSLEHNFYFILQRFNVTKSVKVQNKAQMPEKEFMS